MPVSREKDPHTLRTADLMEKVVYLTEEIVKLQKDLSVILLVGLPVGFN